MDGNAEMLNYIYQNAQMGTNSIKQVMDAAQDQAFKGLLQKQLNGYQEILREAQALLHQNGMEEKGLGKMSEMKTDMMIGVQTLADKSTPHLAEMMLLGSNMGVVDALKNLRRYDDAKPDVKGLMKKLLHFEEQNAEHYKPLV